MEAHRRRYTREFKLEAVRRAQQPGTTQTEVAEELGIKPEMLYKWKRQLGEDPQQALPGQGSLKPRDKEVEQLRKQVRRLEAENAFLKRVSAYLAKEKK